MHKKNIPQDKNTNKQQTSSSRFVDLATKAALIASMLSSSPNYGQIIKSSPDLHKKNTKELIQKQSNLPHQQKDKSIPNPKEWPQEIGLQYHQNIITKNIQDIFHEYGQEGGLDIIRKHMLIEINTYRALNGIGPLTLSPVLNDLAQTFAEYGSPYQALGHSFAGKGYEDMGIDLGAFSATAENVAYGMEDISSIVEGRYSSPGHKKTLLGLWVSEHSGASLDFDQLGIGVSGKFVVADFGLSKTSPERKKYAE